LLRCQGTPLGLGQLHPQTKTIGRRPIAHGLIL
jgi:hypothetical protein